MIEDVKKKMKLKIASEPFIIQIVGESGKDWKIGQ